jgi:hypothetical protein
MSILEAIKKFKNNEINDKEYISLLDKVLEQSKKKKDSLEKANILSSDKEIWESTIKPGLTACFLFLGAAAMEAKEYVKNRDEKILVNVVAIFNEIDKVISGLETKVKGSSSLMNVITNNLVDDKSDLLEVNKYKDSKVIASLDLNI